MKSKLIIAILLFSFMYCFSQDYLIVNTIQGKDSIALAQLKYERKDYGFGVKVYGLLPRVGTKGPARLRLVFLVPNAIRMVTFSFKRKSNNNL